MSAELRAVEEAAVFLNQKGAATPVTPQLIHWRSRQLWCFVRRDGPDDGTTPLLHWGFQESPGALLGHFRRYTESAIEWARGDEIPL